MNNFRNYLLLFLPLIILAKQSFAESLQEVFTQIYNTSFWGSKESLSGGGSSLQETKNIRKRIPELLKELNVKVFLDAPCGDFNWMQHVDLNFLDQYIGIDIVEPLIKKNKQKYENENRHFICANIVTDPLPQADIILCRDCLAHLKFADIIRALQNIKSNGITYLLATTYPNTKSNKNLTKIGYQSFPLNLQLSPFNFPEPLKLIHEGSKYNRDKSLGLWRIKDIIK